MTPTQQQMARRSELEMKIAMQCFGLMALSLVGCAADGRNDDSSTAQSQSDLSAASANDTTITAHLTVGVREALRAAMGESDAPQDMTSAVVPGVLVLRHNFSVERLTLTVSEWQLGSRTEAGPPDVFTPHMERVALRFPAGGDASSAAHVRAAAAAKKLFDAMKNAEEETRPVGGAGQMFIRHAASRAISCSFEPAHGAFPERHECTIAVHMGVTASN